MNAAGSDVLTETLTIEQRVTEQLPLVKRITYHLLARLPSNIEPDDLMQAGMMGLLAAAKDFSPERGASFATYAGIRIKGAILDEVRQNNWAPRSVQKKASMLSRAVREVESKSAGPATDRALADELGVSLEDYRTMTQEVATSHLLNIDEGEIVVGSDTYNPASLLQSDGLKESVVAAIEQLPEKEKLVMSLYYQDELNLKEIGEVLGVSESRVCQIHGQALTRIRARLADWMES